MTGEDDSELGKRLGLKKASLKQTSDWERIGRLGRSNGDDSEQATRKQLEAKQATTKMKASSKVDVEDKATRNKVFDSYQRGQLAPGDSEQGNRPSANWLTLEKRLGTRQMPRSCMTRILWIQGR